MLPKIRYRLCWNYSCKLNRDLLAPIALECRQGSRKMYISSKVMLSEGQWHRGMVVNHENAEKLTAYLIHWRNSVEEIELDALLKGKHLTLFQLKTAIKSGVRPNATIREFVESVIGSSDRKKATQRSYQYLCNEIEKDYGRITLDDITHDWIEKYRAALKKTGVSENTIRGRMKLLKCITNEAMKRNLITDDPFKFITIGHMTARVGYLEADEVRRLEELELSGQEEKVRDIFLLACYTGLRYGDLSTLEEATIENGILSKKMHKTNFWVHIPIDTIFWGKARKIIDKYPNIRELSHAACNTTINRVLKTLAVKAGISKNIYCHLGRKTCSCLLNQMGMNLQDISAILGHTTTEITSKHYIFDDGSRLCKTVGDIFKK